METWVERNVEPMLLDVGTSWQPTSLLPDPAADNFYDELKLLREECKRLPPEFWVVFVGDMVTEEALPSYMSMLNRMDSVKDNSGAQSDT
jgi:acyl-[acyl-carrier-protein] desaturase